MNEDVVARAFEPFFTTKDVSKGSGLGLAMVFGFAKQSNGHVEIASAPGAGTTVRIFLPRAEAEARDPTVINRAIMAGSGQKILLVEDDPSVRRFVDELLVSLGYKVVSARDADEALRMVPQMERPDLLLSDIVLTGSQRGPELARKLQLVWPELPLLFMTGYADDLARMNELTEGGAEIIRKPFRRNEIAGMIHAILNSGT